MMIVTVLLLLLAQVVALAAARVALRGAGAAARAADAETSFAGNGGGAIAWVDAAPSEDATNTPVIPPRAGSCAPAFPPRPRGLKMPVPIHPAEPKAAGLCPSTPGIRAATGVAPRHRAIR